MSRQGCVISPSKRQICNSARQCFDFSASARVHPAQAPLDRCVQLAASSQRWIAKVCCTAQHESDPSCSGRWAQQDTATAVAVLWGLEGEDPETVCQPREGDQDHDADRCRHEEQVQGDRPRRTGGQYCGVLRASSHLACTPCPASKSHAARDAATRAALCNDGKSASRASAQKGLAALGC